MLSFLDIFGAKKAPPQLTFGMPIDLSADVPIFPPFALMLTMMTARLMWKLSGKRLSYVPAPLSALPVRIAILAIGLACTKFLVLDKAGGELKAAGSGTLFTPVGGLAVDGIYQMTRNVRAAARVRLACSDRMPHSPTRHPHVTHTSPAPCPTIASVDLTNAPMHRGLSLGSRCMLASSSLRCRPSPLWSTRRGQFFSRRSHGRTSTLWSLLPRRSCSSRNLAHSTLTTAQRCPAGSSEDAGGY